MALALYKPGQGVTTRWVSGVLSALLILFGCYRLYVYYAGIPWWYTWWRSFELECTSCREHPERKDNPTRTVVTSGHEFADAYETELLCKACEKDTKFREVRRSPEGLRIPPVGLMVSGLLLLGGIFGVYALIVNHPKSTDFLIEVEAELRKVSWPPRHEFVGSSVVVIICVVLLGVFLRLADLLLGTGFQFLGF